MHGEPKSTGGITWVCREPLRVVWVREGAMLAFGAAWPPVVFTDVGPSIVVVELFPGANACTR